MTAPALTRTMVLWSPDWPITAASRANGFTESATVALIEKGLVFACSAAARAEGVKRGQRVREAQARCTGLIVVPYEPILDARAFEPVIAAIEAMVPGVQLLRPGTCAIRSRGPARYFGGEKAAAIGLIGVLAQLGIPGTRVGIADGPFAAQQAARRMSVANSSRPSDVTIVPGGASPEFLAPLPVGLLGDPVLVTLLQRLGIRTMAGFAALGVEDVRDRFGEPAAWLHSLASGFDGRAVDARIPPKHLDVEIEFEPPLDRVDQVTFAVRSTADRFITALTAEKLVCTAVQVQIDTERGDLSERSWLHPRSFSASDVVDRVRWQLQGSGEIDAGLRSAVVRVRLVPESVDSIGNHEHGLWGTAPDERIHHGLSRVQSMLGHGAVLTAAVGGGRMLAERQRLVAWGDREDTKATAAQPWPGHLPSPAPATVFAVPHPVHVFADNGESVTVDERGALSAAPARFSSTGAARSLREITAWAGPWIIDQRWWDESASQRASRFQVVDSEGSAWLLVLDGDHWLLEAKYD